MLIDYDSELPVCCQTTFYQLSIFLERAKITLEAMNHALLNSRVRQNTQLTSLKYRKITQFCMELYNIPNTYA
jgi:hypothetical protein